MCFVDVGGGHPSPRRGLLSGSVLLRGRGLAGKETGRGRVRVSGSWEPERETLKGQQGSVIPSLANFLALDQISKHSVSLRIVREQSQTFRSTSQAPELCLLFSLFHTSQILALKDTGALASDLSSNLPCQQPGSYGHSPPPATLCSLMQIFGGFLFLSFSFFAFSCQSGIGAPAKPGAFCLHTGITQQEGLRLDCRYNFRLGRQLSED